MRVLFEYSDEQLLRMMSQEDENAFSELYERYWKQLYISAYTILKNKAASEDVVQEVFLSIWNRRSSVAIESLSAYLKTSVRFQVLKAIRNEKTDRDFYKRLVHVSNNILTDDPILFKELEQLANKIITHLPEDQSSIFQMSRHGKTYKEIAKQKGISIKTVEKKISKSLQVLHLGLDDFIPILLAAYLFL